MTLPGLVAAQNLADVVDREKAWDNLGSSVSVNVSISSPSLDLNFAKNKSLVDDISGNNLITFSRASTGTFVGSNGLLQTAASGVPRFDHNPTTGESLGLLVEEARTNLVLRSEEFDNAYWSKTGATITPNATAAPNETTTADKLVETAVSNLHFAGAISLGLGSNVYTVSVFAKAAERTEISIFMNTSVTRRTQFFNLSTGALGANSGGLTCSIQAFANGWYKCSITLNAAETLLDVVYTTALSGTNNYLGDATSGVFLWGAQLEAGTFPTSYIPTTSSTVTRAADVASMTGTNFSSWYNQTEGTVFAEVALAQPNIGDNQFVFRTSNNTFGNAIAVNILGSAQLSTALDNTFDGFAVSVANLVANVSAKIGAAYATNNLGISLNGATAVTDTSAIMPTGLNRADVGSDHIGLNRVNAGTIKRLAYYPVRLANLALQYITSASGSLSSTTYPYTFAIKGKDTLALNGVSNASARSFVFIKGLSTFAQPRITTAAQQAASGTALRDAAMLKASPTTIGNYFFSSGITLSGVSTRINGTPALSINTFPFSGSTATASILLGELRPQTNWRITEPMASGTIASPEFAIPFETNNFVLFMKAGQN